MSDEVPKPGDVKSVLAWLERVALNEDYPLAVRMQAAIVVLPYAHPKLIEAVHKPRSTREQ